MDTKYILYIQPVEAVGVYAIHNKENGKYYIGSSVNIKHRQEMHKKQMMRLEAPNIKIKKDLNSFSDLTKFEFLILEIFPDNTITESFLRNREEFYIKKYDAYNNGYNTYCPKNTGHIKQGELLKCKILSKNTIDLSFLESESDAEILDTFLNFSSYEIKDKSNTDLVSLSAVIKYIILERMANQKN